MPQSKLIPHIFQSLPAFALDRTGKIILWNEACASITGLPAELLLGRSEPWRAFWSSARPVLANELMKGKIRKTSPGIIAITPDCAAALSSTDRSLDNMSNIWTLAALYRDEHGEITSCVQVFKPVPMHDILSDSTLLQNLIEKFPVPVALVQDGRYIATNKLNVALLGEKKLEDVLGKKVLDYIADEEKDRFLAANDNGFCGLETGGSYRWKYRINKSLRYLEGHPTIFRWNNSSMLLTTVQDVTEIEEREKRLESENHQLMRENAQLLYEKGESELAYLGTGARLRKTLDQALKMGRTNSNLVILGETGTGKSFLAKIIHNISPRHAGPFVMVNCAAIPESLFESQFFGHMRGAFTGADKNHTGFLARANHGTLFLDEVGELGTQMQAKLLHALEQGKFTPLGATEAQNTDVRIICATNRNVRQMLQEGSLREDFFYRIFVMDISIPPLRECREDLPDIIRFFFKKLDPLAENVQIPLHVLREFMEYDWPGNVRELQNTILRYLVTGRIDFPGGKAREVLAKPEQDFMGEGSLAEMLDAAEKRYILRTLRLCNFNKILAAEKLGVNLRTFHRKCARHGLIRKLEE